LPKIILRRINLLGKPSCRRKITDILPGPIIGSKNIAVNNKYCLAHLCQLKDILWTKLPDAHDRHDVLHGQKTMVVHIIMQVLEHLIRLLDLLYQPYYLRWHCVGMY
jgi:hypothetical protein